MSMIIRWCVLSAGCALLLACDANDVHTLVTIADARTDKAHMIDTGSPGDSVGDMVVFDQPLLNSMGDIIGNNSGVCVRTRVAKIYQCQWTLTFSSGTIQVAGREADNGTSAISIVGGTGTYAGISGEMISINNNDGTFTQTLRYRLH